MAMVAYEEALILEVAMAKLVHAVIIKYCTDVIWHRLHGAHCSHHMMMCNANLFLGCDTHTHSHTLHCQSVNHTD